MREELTVDLAEIGAALQSSSLGQIDLNPDTVEQDLARLVLGLVELLRQVLELRAIRRLEDGKLTHEQEELLGGTLMRAEEAIHEIAAKFGLRPEDLSLDLGPLGKTV